MRYCRLAIAMTTLWSIGCGQIREVPVELSTSGTSESGSEDTTAAHFDSSGDRDTDDEPEQDHDGNGTTQGDPVDYATTTDGEPEITLRCIEAPQDIPDDGEWLEMGIVVESSETGVSMGIGVRASHPRVSDLNIELQSPSGIIVPLVSNPSCFGANIDARFDDTAPGGNQCSEQTTAAISGLVNPLRPLAPFLTQSLEGTWTLRVRDSIPGTVGYLNNWCLVIETEAS